LGLATRSTLLENGFVYVVAQSSGHICQLVLTAEWCPNTRRRIVEMGDK